MNYRRNKFQKRVICRSTVRKKTRCRNLMLCIVYQSLNHAPNRTFLSVKLTDSDVVQSGLQNVNIVGSQIMESC